MAACPPLSPERAAALPIADVLARVPDCSPDVLAAAGAAVGAAADLITAGQLPNPQLTVGAGAVGGAGVGNGSVWSKTFDHQLRLDQVIERGGKPALRLASAEARQQVARADLGEARRQGRASAARIYFDLAAALARQRETSASVALNQDSQRALELRVRAGDAPALDAVRFGLDVIRQQADLRQSQAEVRGLRLQLAAQIGAEDQVDVLTPTPDFGRIATPPLDLAPVLELRPDVVAARARVAAAEQARNLVRAQQIRDIGVGVALSHYPANQVNTSGTGNTVSVSVTVPLFLRHAFEGDIARAEADVRLAEEVLRRVRLTAQADVLRARADWEAADARYRLIVEQLAPSAERVAAGAELAYRRGATGVLDVLDARRSLRAAQIERINAEADRARAAAQLEAALLPPDLSAPP